MSSVSYLHAVCTCLCNPGASFDRSNWIHTGIVGDWPVSTATPSNGTEWRRKHVFIRILRYEAKFWGLKTLTTYCIDIGGILNLIEFAHPKSWIMNYMSELVMTIKCKVEIFSRSAENRCHQLKCNIAQRIQNTEISTFPEYFHDPHSFSRATTTSMRITKHISDIAKRVDIPGWAWLPLDAANGNASESWIEMIAPTSCVKKPRYSEDCVSKVNRRPGNIVLIYPWYLIKRC